MNILKTLNEQEQTFFKGNIEESCNFFKDISLFPKREVAHWKWVEETNLDDIRKIQVFECSKCGRKITVDTRYQALIIDYPYCHCGCKMMGR